MTRCGTLRAARRWRTGAASVVLLALLSLRCQLGFECDPHVVVARLAGADATDCGAVDGWEQTVADDIVAARACVASALAESRPFFATASPASSDGGTVVGYASDGVARFRVRYDYRIAIGCLGGDSESMEQERCELVLDAGASCGTADRDLCFRCENPAPISGSCR